MNTIDIREIINCDINVYNIVGIGQEWSVKCHCWNYTENPRKNSGLIYILKGKAKFTVGKDKIITAVRGDVLYLPKGINYYVEFTPPESRSMLINFEISYKDKDINLSDSIFVAARDNNFLLYGMFSELCESYISICDKLLIKSKLLAAISEISKISSCSFNSNPVNTAVFYINNHLNNSINISELAKMCAMSESTFRRNFKTILGCGPKEYINTMKIKKAKQMLSNSDAAINEICSALGFYDNAHFTKVFKNAAGITPAEYKKHC